MSGKDQGFNSLLNSGDSKTGNVLNSNIKDKVLYSVKQTKIRINGNECDIKDLNFNINKEVWEHDYLEMEFTIHGQETGRYHSYVFSLDNLLEIELNRITESGGEDWKNIFYGPIENIDIELSAGERAKCKIRTYSESIKMDKIRKYRSFLDPGITYKRIAETIMGNYGLKYKLAPELEQSIKHVYIQNGETDWQFLKRILSDVNIPLFSHLSEILFGEINSETYPVDLSSAIYGRGREQGNILFKVNGTDPYNIGEKVKVQFEESGHNMSGTKLVSKSFLFIEDKYIKCKCELVDTEGFHEYEKYENNTFIGKSIEGNVIEVLNSDGIAKLTVDLTQGLKKCVKDDREKAYADEYAGKWGISYVTPYSSSNTGLFCTPEKGDNVKLFFGSNSEEDAYIQGAVNNPGNGRFSDYENRNFHVNGSDFNMIVAKDNFSLCAASSIAHSSESITESAKTIANNSENHVETVRNDKTVIAKNINHTAAKNTTIKSNANTSITANGVSTVSGGQKVNING